MSCKEGGRMSSKSPGPAVSWTCVFLWLSYSPITCLESGERTTLASAKIAETVCVLECILGQQDVAVA